MDELLQRPVTLHGVRIGHVVDVIVDASDERAIGLEVRCKDRRHRFLPAAAASPVGEEVVVDSPFALLDTDELEFYRSRGFSLRRRGESAA